MPRSYFLLAETESTERFFTFKAYTRLSFRKIKIGLFNPASR